MRGDHFAYRQNFMDLDPTYTDKWGDPLLRMTLDWTDYEMRQMAFGARMATQLLEVIAQVSGATLVKESRRGTALSSLQRRPIHHDAHSGRSDHGKLSRAKRRQPLAAALEDAESFCGRLVVVSAKFFRQSNAYDRRGQSPRGRWID